MKKYKYHPPDPENEELHNLSSKNTVMQNHEKFDKSEPTESSVEVYSSSPKNQIPWKIYLSRALSAWGDRIWAFSVGIFMNKLAPENLRVVAIYGFVISISVIIFGAMIGNWIDRNKRLLAAKVLLSVQNFSVALACIIIVGHYMLWKEKEFPNWVIPAVVILISNVANLASVGSKIILERDWIIIVADGDDNKLATMNALLRTIDLIALVVSPAFAGVIFDFINDETAAAVIGIWNVVSVFVEYYLLLLIYKEFPELSKKNVAKQRAQTDESTTNEPSLGKRICCFSQSSLSGWKLYMTHSICRAGLGLAFLYMTVLGFDNITYGFCLSQCVTEWLLGVLVGVSAVIGVIGSLAFPYIRKCIGLEKTGIVGMSALVSALSLCVVSVWVEGSPFDPFYYTYPNITIKYKCNETMSLENEMKINDAGNNSIERPKFLSVSILLVGLISARFGLWVTDLSITQIIQENVDEDKRGIISGVQNGMNSLMDSIKYTLVISLPEDETFGYLIIASFCSICFGALLYTSYAVKMIRKKSTTNLKS